MKSEPFVIKEMTLWEYALETLSDQDRESVEELIKEPAIEAKLGGESPASNLDRIRTALANAEHSSIVENEEVRLRMGDIKVHAKLRKNRRTAKRSKLGRRSETETATRPEISSEELEASSYSRSEIVPEGLGENMDARSEMVPKGLDERNVRTGSGIVLVDLEQGLELCVRPNDDDSFDLSLRVSRAPLKGWVKVSRLVPGEGESLTRDDVDEAFMEDGGVKFPRCPDGILVISIPDDRSLTVDLRA